MHFLYSAIVYDFIMPLANQGSSIKQEIGMSEHSYIKWRDCAHTPFLGRGCDWNTSNHLRQKHHQNPILLRVLLNIRWHHS